MKNIGASILPSSSPEILKPIPFPGNSLWSGLLQIEADETEDTHKLFLIRGDEKIFLASHPNGFSCHSLARRIVTKERKAVADQICYIIACGGIVSQVCASIANGFSSSPKPQTKQQNENPQICS